MFQLSFLCTGSRRRSGSLLLFGAEAGDDPAKKALDAELVEDAPVFRFGVEVIRMR